MKIKTILLKILDTTQDIARAVANKESVPGVARVPADCGECSCGLKAQLVASAEALRQIECRTAQDWLVFSGIDYTETHKIALDGWREATKK